MLLCACLFGLGACDSTSSPTPDSGPDAGADAGPTPTCEDFSCTEGACSMQDGQPVCLCADGSAPPCAPPVIPAGHTLLTPSAEVQTVAWEDQEVPRRFAFVAWAGRHYDLIAEPRWSSYTLTLRDAAGVKLDSVEPMGMAPYTWHWSGLTGGAVYTVEVKRYAFQWQSPFVFRFVDQGPDDHGDLLRTATPWTPSEQSLTGFGEHVGERDLFSFPTVAGNVYSLGCTFPTQDWELSFLNGQVATSFGFVDSAPYAATQAATAFKSAGGVHHASIKDKRSAPSSVPYNCVLRDMGPDDHNDNSLEGPPTVLPPGTASVQGRLGYVTDNDDFSLGVLPRHHYRVSCTLDGPMGCEVRTAAPGDVIDNYSDDKSKMTFKTTHATHFVRVGGNRVVPARWVEGHYTLQFEDLGEDDHGDWIDTATPLTGSVQVVQGRITDVIDSDYFSFQAIAGWTYRISSDWRETPDQYQLYSSIYDDQGFFIRTSRTHVGSRWNRDFTAPKTGTYFIGLGAESKDNVGDYTFEFRVLDP
ncbi:hypothetical protein D7V93_20070 [Corallococcus llansteffanensis]|uniref:Uncharacterized protein n=1 Tax=Corallococcus llansteffanensis TaxID=2316731 RepID=A0A3A8PP70_9BACT|nr:hypothetical protein D7V93_20070 [Corallococcus llansteffanensis]